ncbi:hypothetical protein HanLR1_Chr01g0010231 [Helianthus annuus]|nr:hypothetical protein HanLR1_Chr01g0010231 [Helianthus annuus]
MFYHTLKVTESGHHFDKCWHFSTTISGSTASKVALWIADRRPRVNSSGNRFRGDIW